jgi:hypothetical protein
VTRNEARAAAADELVNQGAVGRDGFARPTVMVNMGKGGAHFPDGAGLLLLAQQAERFAHDFTARK